MNRKLLILLSLITLVYSNSYLKASTNDDNAGESIYQSGKLYSASSNQMEEIDNAILAAKNSDKLVLIVMGANWCHDSRGLASKLYLPEVKNVIDENYELIFVDVGYLTKVKNVITRFNMPVIYATPTVLVINPDTEQRINGHNMHIWREADSISVADTITYFKELANNKRNLSESRLVLDQEQQMHLKSLNQSIDKFEQKQANRLYGAFSIIGPLLKQRNENGNAKDFFKHWSAVSKFRYKITDDLSKLRQQAINIAKNKELVEKLVFPKYPAFDWE